jgi:hypothetical protein
VASQAEQPLGQFEYELTDELAVQSAVAFFQLQIQHVKEGLPAKGMTAPVTSLATAMLALLFAIGLVLFTVDNSAVKWIVIGVAFLVLLFLSFKTALYYVPPFTRWYAGRRALRTARELPDRHVKWTLYEDRIVTQTASKERSVRWSDVRRLLALPDFWFLGVRSGPILLVPARFLDEQIQTVLARKAGEAGAVIEHRPSPEASNQPG